MKIDEDYLVGLVQALVRARSVNPVGDQTRLKDNNEAKIARVVEAVLKKSGIRCNRVEIAPDRPVVTADIGDGQGRTLILNSHLDTVDVEGMAIQPFSGEIRDGRLYGRGSTDAKGSLGAMIAAMTAVAAKPIKGKCVLTAVCDEEHEGIGTKYIAGHIKADAAIIGEPTELKIGIAQPGGMKFKIRTSGKSTHGCTPSGGVNAIEKMVKLIARLPETTIGHRHPLIGAPTLNIGQIRGGTDPSIVPDYCEIVCDRRLLPNESPEEVLNEIDGLLKLIKQDDPRFEATREPPFLGPVSGFDIAADQPIVRAVCRMYEKVTNREAEITGTPYGSDAAYLVHEGIPSVTFGPGSIIDSHSNDESIAIESLLTAAEVYALAILEFCD